MSIKFQHITWAALAVTLILSACGGDVHVTPSTPTAEGSLLNSPPPRTASLTASALTATLQSSQYGQTLLRMAGGTLACGVDVNYIQYATVGGAREATTASGVLMVPTGSGPNCTGTRPVVEYAHGTSVARSYNLASTDPTNQAYSDSLYLATLYAAQGYVVVAPNYAGYDSSTLNYHPYLNADQQSKDMIDALSAAKTALPQLTSPTKASGKLFVTGYSAGAYAAMATARAMQAAGIPVTASAFLSGPYVPASFGDAIFYGEVNIGSTEIIPLILTSYQKAYGNIYSSPADVYESAYASGIETLLPGPYNDTTIFPSGKLPATALFSSTPPVGPAALQPTLDAISPPTGTGATDALFALGFGPNNLILNSFRLSYLLDAFSNPDGVVPALTTGEPSASPQNPLRIAFKKNDLRGWTPTSPVLLCGGHNDPTVFFSLNTGLMKQQWAGLGSLVTELDVDSAPDGDGFDTARQIFMGAEAAAVASGGSTAVIETYHTTLAAEACGSAAATFFTHQGN
ncbi:prolyl oligopeptidase family serine peptidase [Caballeronia sp. LjRoot34]|uniref:alpha/beta hydrolase family protein n=1 Tax=Caballeronia sp. LjRoot34 TaxID=3342325 RepID=UPI003ECF478F